jgi:hypothetical protein
LKDFIEIKIQMGEIWDFHAREYASACIMCCCSL